ncbi:hypothetical protein N9V90_03040, partial [Endozoicomonas sp.]|nr:hypothetical protein [Endozoicomonas sp.]
MDSIGSQTALYPLLPLIGSSLPAGANITPVVGTKYHAINSLAIGATDLYDRHITQVPAAWRYSPHSPVVGKLLQRRSVLQQQLLSVQGMNAYTAFVNQIPHLNGWLNAGVLPASLPFNFLFHANGHAVPVPLPDQPMRATPDFCQPLSTYINDQSSVFQAAANTLQPYSPLLHLYESVLHQQLIDNYQQMLFQGHAGTANATQSLRVYPLDDLVSYSYWIGAPSDYPLVSVRGYSFDQQAFWPNQQNGFLASREPILQAWQGSISSEKEESLYRQPLWQPLVKYLGPFGYPVNPIDRDTVRAAGRAKAIVETDEVREGFDESMDDDSEIGADERLAAVVAPKLQPIEVDSIPVKEPKEPVKTERVLTAFQEQDYLEKDKRELLEQREKAVQVEGVYREQTLELENQLQVLEKKLRQLGAEKQKETQALKNEISELKHLLNKGENPTNEAQKALAATLAEKELQLLKQQTDYGAERQELQREIQGLKGQLQKVEKDAVVFKKDRDDCEKEYKKLIAQQEKAIQAEQELKKEKIIALEQKIHELQQRCTELEAPNEESLTGLESQVNPLNKRVFFEGNTEKEGLLNQLIELEEQLNNEKQKIHAFEKQWDRLEKEKQEALEERDKCVKAEQEYSRVRIENLEQGIKKTQDEYEKLREEKDLGFLEMKERLINLQQVLDAENESKEALLQELKIKKEEFSILSAGYDTEESHHKKIVDQQQAQLDEARKSIEFLKKERSERLKEQKKLLNDNERRMKTDKEHNATVVSELKRKIKSLQSHYRQQQGEKEKIVEQLKTLENERT